MLFLRNNVPFFLLWWNIFFMNWLTYLLLLCRASSYSTCMLTGLSPYMLSNCYMTNSLSPYITVQSWRAVCPWRSDQHVHDMHINKWVFSLSNNKWNFKLTSDSFSGTEESLFSWNIYLLNVSTYFIILIKYLFVSWNKTTFYVSCILTFWHFRILTILTF